MKQGITITREYDHHDRPVVRITKRRGKLTLEEVSDLLRTEGWGEWNGYYHQRGGASMAALKEVAREYASEIRDGIGWVIVYRRPMSRPAASA